MNRKEDERKELHYYKQIKYNKMMVNGNSIKYIKINFKIDL